jgi:XRE family transcriptional regulator, regulator of sulfur utilization
MAVIFEMCYYPYMTSREHEKMRKELGEKLRAIREAARLTQQEVADVAGMHVNYYARIERGGENPTYDKLQGIKRALSIKSLDLL